MPIRLLPTVVVNRIAAGEVVERPASAVKELVENAIDAGARHVDIAIEGGGLVRIAVVDDGGGMPRADLELAVERHATSKIAVADDLSRISTLGFRGEALASIAAVSDLRITTRPGDAGSGAVLHVRQGAVLGTGAAASPAGTTVEVCELFAGVPARLRFLRSVATEAAAAVRVAADLALTHPEVAVTCRNEGRLALRTTGGSLRDAIRAVLGARAERDLIGVDAPGEVAIGGAISLPHAHRASRSGLVIIVNGRLVHSRVLAAAFDESYRGLIPGGRHGYGVLTVDVALEDLDVNVHPAKREVRFRDERAVFSALQRACWAALRAAPPQAAAGIAPDTMGAYAVLDVRDGDAVAQLTGHVAVARADPAHPRAITPADAIGGAPEIPDGTRPSEPMIALGQAGSGFLVASAGGAVVLIDPHAAHEKVLYTEILDRWDQESSKGNPETQLLLIPVIVECGPAKAARVAAAADLFARSGFTIELFGPDAVRCTAVPIAAARADPERLVTEVIEGLDEPSTGGAARRHWMAALVACHAAVRFGDRLDITAQQRLLDQVRATPGGTTCPHGRPSMLVLEEPVLRRAFRRPPR